MPSAGPPFTFAVVADTHVRPASGDTQAAYPSDAHHNDRARRAVELIGARSPAFVVHLGDITHTLPGLAGHDEAVRLAGEIFGDLSCPIVWSPGNHDVGDKPDSQATAPPVDPGRSADFERQIGPAWRSWDHGGCHFVAIDSPILGTGTPREREQRTWLEADLTGQRRIFLFMHDPPYLHRPGEPAHYDNLAEPARSWLLALIQRHPVEAVFAGHVHNFFFCRHGEAHLYCAPSTAFVRPEYSELFPVEPAAENGRDDADKLGLLLVHVDDGGHRVELARTATGDATWDRPAAPSPVGVWLRGGWSRTVDLPHGDLDEFRRKTARNDYPLLGLWDLGISRVRIPLADLHDPPQRERLADLVATGAEVLAFSVGVPEGALAGSGDLVHTWEVILRPGEPLEVLDAIGDPPVPLALSRIAAGPGGDGEYFSHFPHHGLRPDDPGLEALARRDPAYLVFRVPPEVRAWDGVCAAVARAEALGCAALCHVELPRGDEGRPHTDDMAIARRVAGALLVASAHPRHPVYLDTYEDKDRGYFPRHGLLDRRGNPRAAARVLRNLGRLVHGQAARQDAAEGSYRLPAGTVVLRPSGPGPWTDLITARTQDDPPAGPALRPAREGR